MEGDKVTVYGTARANKHYGTDDLGNEAEIIIEAAKSDLSKFKFHDVFLVITGKSVDAANAVGRRIKSGIISMIILIGLCVSLVYLGYQGMQDFDSIYHSKHLIGMYDDMQ
jgi:hypothetical protein